MKKVVLTQEQTNAIEAFRILEQNNKQILKYNFHKLPEIDKDTFAEPINAMDFDTLVKALYIGYEVEPKFKVGDWVVFKENGRVFKVTNCNDKFMDVDNLGGAVGINLFRHATDEEIAQEEERRMDKELNDILKGLKPEERVIMWQILDGKEV